MAAETELERLVLRLTTDVKGYIGPLQAAMDKTQQLAKEIDSLGARLVKTSQSLSQLGHQITMRVTAPILATATGVYALGVSFEDEMSKIVGLVGVSRDQVNAWSEDILKLAPEIGKAPDELARAMFFVTSAGFRGAAAMDVLTMSAKASAAGLGATSVVADAVTSAVNAYAKQNMTAARATDILTAAVREGKLEAASLAPVLGGILPTAAALGVSLEDVAGVMAVMSRTGTGAAEASTSIQAILMTLQKPTEAAAELLGTVGLSFAHLREIARGPEGLIGVIRTLSNAFEGNDEALAQIVPNIRALRGVMNALAQDAGTVDAIMQGVRNSTGDMNKSFLVMMDSAGMPLRQTLAQLKTLFISLGSAVIPVVNIVLSALNFVLKSLQMTWGILPGIIQKTIVVITAIVASIGLFLTALAAAISLLVSVVGVIISVTVVGSILSLMFTGSFLPLIGVIIASLTGLLPVLIAVKAGILAYTLATKAATVATIFWQALMGPAGWLVIATGIALATAAVVAYIHATKEATGESKKAGDEAAEAMEAAKKAGGEATRAIEEFEDSMRNAATGVAEVTSEVEKLREGLLALESPTAAYKVRWLKFMESLETDLKARKKRLAELEKVMAAARWEIAEEAVKGAKEERMEMLRRSLRGVGQLYEYVSAKAQELEGRIEGLRLEHAGLIGEIEEIDLRSPQEQFDALVDHVNELVRASADLPGYAEKAQRFLEKAFGETPMGEMLSEIDDMRFALRELEEGWDGVTRATENFYREHQEASMTDVAEVMRLSARQQAAALKEQYATPFEKAKKEVKDLNQLLVMLTDEQGRIQEGFAETYQRGMEDIIKRYEEATKIVSKADGEGYVSQGVEAIRRGSVQEAILRQESRIAMSGSRGEQTVQEEQRDLQKEIRDNTAPLKVTITPTTISIVPSNLAGA